MTRLPRFGPAVAFAVTLAVAGGFVVVLANRPEVLGMLTNADLLLPAAFASDLIRHGAAAWQFQLPRVPSLLPDVSAIVLLQAAFGWRLAALAYAVGAFVALVAVGGAVAAQLADRSVAMGAAAVLTLTAALLGVLWPSEATQPLLLTLAPAVHSGSFVLALAALLWAGSMTRQPADARRRMSLVALAAAGMLSDKLFAGAFLMPLLAALGVSVWQGHVPRRLAMRVAWLAVAGVATGWAADRLLFAHLLRREPDVGLFSPDTPDHVRLFLRQPMLPWLAFAMSAVWALPLLVRRPTPGQVFWWSVLAVTPPLFMALTAILYVDHTSMRYAQPAFWLPVFAAAGLLLRIPVVGGALVTIATAAVGVSVALQPWPRPALLSWRDPLAACLLRAEAQGILHSGLADYWLARPLEASADWSLQVDQVTPDGARYLWGNNRHWYAHDRDDPGRPPTLDFIVAAQLDPAAIASRYGPPASTIACPGSEIWLYPPNRLQAVTRS